jgi:hypothetical protein
MTAQLLFCFISFIFSLFVLLVERREGGDENNKVVQN